MLRLQSSSFIAWNIDRRLKFTWYLLSDRLAYNIAYMLKEEVLGLNTKDTKKGNVQTDIA